MNVRLDTKTVSLGTLVISVNTNGKSASLNVSSFTQYPNGYSGSVVQVSFNSVSVS